MAGEEEVEEEGEQMEDGAEVAPSARGSRDKYSNERYDWRKKMGKNFLEEQVEEKEREVEEEEERRRWW